MAIYLTNFNTCSVFVVGGSELKEIREFNGLSQSEMADILGIAPRTYQRYEVSGVPENKLKFIKRNLATLNQNTTDNIASKTEATYQIINSNKLESQVVEIANEYRMPKSRVKGLIEGSIKPSNEKEKEIVSKFNIKNHLIPYYDVDFMAGNSIQQFDNSDAPSYHIDFKPFRGCKAFNSYSDSMCPKIESGMILFGQKKENWMDYLEYGEIYGIVMNDGTKFLKYLRKSKDNSKLLLISENKDYDEFEIPKSEIRSIWLIKGWVKRKI